MAAPGHQFDFVTFLKSRYPGTTYSTERLTGGLVNETVRATRISQGDVANPASIVLKYAPPFVAGRGPHVPFGQERQVVEVLGLELVTGPQSSLLPMGLPDNALVPRLLFHDPDAHVLAITDLGKLDSLTAALNGSSANALSIESATNIGNRLGNFLARLHSPQIFAQAKDRPAGITLASLRGPRALVKAVVVDRIGELLARCEYSNEESSRMQELVSSSWTVCEADAPTILAHGDTWPGSIMIGQSQHCERETDNGTLKIALIDWEFAHFDSSGLPSDMAFLISFLKLHLIASTQKNNRLLRDCCDALLVTVLEVYRAESLGLNAAWPKTLCSIENDKDAVVCTLLQRMAIATGRDMIYNALEMPWNCACCESKYQDTSRCPMRQLMVREGVKHLQNAEDFETCREFIEGDDHLVHLLG